MRKSTATISLVLLGTALALSGCSSRSEEEEENGQGGGGHGGYVGTRVVPGFRGVGGRVGSATATPSVRGGFGGTGSAGVGS